jgi:Ca2+-binding EF-hand superfamily protein
MGSCTSNFSIIFINFKPDDDVPGQTSRVIPMSSELGYSRKDVDIIFSFYRTIDINNDGQLTLENFSQMFRISHNIYFAKLIMKLFDVTETNTIDFEEFLIAVWNLLTLKENDWISFIFQLLDWNGTGKIFHDDLDYIFDTILELSIDKRVEIKAAIRRYGDFEDGTIADKAFYLLTIQFPYILSKFREVCHLLKTNALGEQKWRKLKKTRDKIYGDLPIMDIVYSMVIKPISYQLLIDLYKIELDNNTPVRKVSWDLMSAIQEGSREVSYNVGSRTHGGSLDESLALERHEKPSYSKKLKTRRSSSTFSSFSSFLN